MNFDNAFERLIGHEGAAGLCRGFSPSLHLHDLSSMTISKAKHQPKLDIGRFVFGVDIADSLNKLVAVFGQVSRFAVLVIEACGSGMALVIALASPFKIFRAVISLDAVFVIYRLISKLFGGNAVKSLCDKSVRVHLPCSDGHKNVADLSNCAIQKASTQYAAPTIDVHNRSLNSPYAAQARSLKQAVNARYWKPSFSVIYVHQIIIG